MGYLNSFLAVLLFIRQKVQDKQRRRVCDAGPHFPLMRRMEIDLINNVLKTIQPKSCLEWGTGYSTLYFPNLLTKNASWLSIEHNCSWSEKIRSLNTNKFVTVSYFKADYEPWTDKNSDGAYDDLSSYVNAPDSKGKFDFIMIDGRARVACLLKTIDIINDGGVVVLHDAFRTYYHEALTPFPFQEMFHFRDGKGNGRHQRGVWIGSLQRPIEMICNVKLHRAIWNLYNTIGDIVKII